MKRFSEGRESVTNEERSGRPARSRTEENIVKNARVKTMLLTFFDIRGIVHYEFVPTGQTVNQVYYLEVLEELRERD